MDRPDGPAADVSEELSGGKGVYIGTASPDDMDAVGYEEHEYVAAGTATSYKAEGEQAKDGQWTFAPDGSAEYRTRIIVRTPKKQAKFSGTVVVEWLNVSGGVDAEPEWSNLQEEVTRSGDVWVGVSAQLIGVEGGPVAVKVEGVPGAEQAGMGLKKIDPARYGSLEHPGDGYSFDIYTQVGRALRAGDALGGLEPERIIAAGQSQSAFAMVTYYNGVQPLTNAFDAFFVHSRGGASLPLVGPGKAVGIADSLGAGATIFRTDQDAPVMDIQTEGDLTSILSSYAARQDDSDTFRLWEVAGTAHADVHTVGVVGAVHRLRRADQRRSAARRGQGVVQGLEDVDDLGRAAGVGAAPRREGRGREADDRAGRRRHRARRHPHATGRRPGRRALRPARAQPGGDLHPARLDQAVHRGADRPAVPVGHEYEKKYDASTRATIKAGYALKEDRKALLDFADPSKVPG